jgi:hypothetical protein
MADAAPSHPGGHPGDDCSGKPDGRQSGLRGCAVSRPRVVYVYTTPWRPRGAGFHRHGQRSGPQPHTPRGRRTAPGRPATLARARRGGPRPPWVLDRTGGLPGWAAYS